ncbi:MAG: GGDEF domain-containing protein [Deltaproteobacteria bacterium]|nr:GGDEF domain-containing protein [Deltaproteobacteria bacterium]
MTLQAPRRVDIRSVPPPERARSEPPDSPEDDHPTGRCAPSLPAAAHVDRRDRAVLVRLDGDATGEVISLDPSGMEIGRSSRAAIPVHDGGASRRHARLTVGHEGWVLEDLGSQNGTLVSGSPITRATLRSGDVVQIGERSSFRFALMDATEELLMRELYESSMRDALTGADNRRQLDGRLRAEVAFAERHRRPLSLPLFDIDHFKAINDRYGHPAGDAVLRAVAQLIRGQLRTEDSLARYGGEEFAVLLRDTALPQGVLVAERIRAKLERSEIPVGPADLSVTISGGAATLTCAGESTPEALLATADRRLYAAKRGGRNRVMSADSG